MPTAANSPFAADRMYARPEAIDNTEDLHTIFIDENFSAEYEYSDRFDGFTVKVKAFRRTDDDALYSKYPGKF